MWLKTNATVGSIATFRNAITRQVFRELILLMIHERIKYQNMLKTLDQSHIFFTSEIMSWNNENSF